MDFAMNFRPSVRFRKHDSRGVIPFKPMGLVLAENDDESAEAHHRCTYGKHDIGQVKGGLEDIEIADGITGGSIL